EPGASKRRDWYPVTTAHRAADRTGSKGAAGPRLACRGKPAAPWPENTANPAITAASFEAGLPRSARSSERSLPRTVPGIPLLLLKKGLLDLVVDAHEPLLGASGAIAIMRRLRLGFPHALLRRAQLERQLVRQIHGARAVFLGHFRRFLQQGYDRAPGIVGDHVGFGRRFRCRRERNDRGGFVRDRRSHRNTLRVSDFGAPSVSHL